MITMAYQDDRNRGPRQMFDVTAMKLVCAECGAAVTQLPFEPTQKEDGTYGSIFCYECNKKRRRDRGPSNFGGGNRGGNRGGNYQN